MEPPPAPAPAPKPKPNPLPTSLPPPPPPKSGVRAALEYTGIPASWLSKRPKLPSRNWLIFLSLTSSLIGAYTYDRRQCRKIREAYVDRVKHLAEEPCDPMAWPRKVTVYGAKWPGDEDYDRSLKYFRKYVKPILVAAAIDFEQVGGKRHGDITKRVAKEIQNERRLAAGLDEPFLPPMALPTSKPPEEKRAHKLAGGIVIIGRATLKEFLAGVVQGWSQPLARVDPEEALSKELEDDGVFDEPEEEPVFTGEDDDKPTTPTPVGRVPSPIGSPVFSPLQMKPPTKSSPNSSSLAPAELDTTLAPIPEYPPLLLVPFTNYIGFTQIPLMIWDFFTQRTKVQLGAEHAYALVMNLTRPFDAPSQPSSETSEFASTTATDSAESPSTEPYAPQGGDLDFDSASESYYKSSLSSFSADILKAREKYNASLPAKLIVARALARGTREPTKEEQEHPPPTEVELRAERMKKELRWRGDLKGWDIVWKERKVVWDERLRDVLRVFVSPKEGAGES